jgi:hypothetical protein
MTDQEYEDLDRRELTILGRWFWGTVIAVVAVFLWSVQAYAAKVFKAEGRDGNPAALRLFDKPCTDQKVLSKVMEAMRDKLKAAQLTYGGAEWASCWIELNGSVYSIDEEGAPFQPVPRYLFKEEGV